MYGEAQDGDGVMMESKRKQVFRAELEGGGGDVGMARRMQSGRKFSKKSSRAA